MNGWEAFLTAEAGASAALAGLIFVGISLNLTKILAFPALPMRAMQALMYLGTILILSSILLMPGQALSLNGIEILITGVVLWVLTVRLDTEALKRTQGQFRDLIRMNTVFNQITLLPYFLTGLAVLIWGAPGSYGLIFIVVFSFIKSLSDAWVLTIEINR